jgi:imidazolonepropionase-like amidohydrolase
MIQNIRKQKWKFILLFCCYLIGFETFSQSDPTAERRITGTIAITNATIVTTGGNKINNASIFIKDGVIQEIGTKITLPKGVQVIPGDSLIIYPGFIDGGSFAGVGRPTDPEKPANFDPSNPPDEFAGITPWRSVLDYYDFKNNQIFEWRKQGFTIANIIPQGGMIAGKTAIVTLGSQYSSNVLEKDKAMAFRFRPSRNSYPGTVMGIMAKFRDLYKNTELAAQHQNLFLGNPGIQRPEYSKTLEALYPVVDKRLPLVFEATEHLEIKRVLSLQKEFGFNLILLGASEVSEVVNELKNPNIKVILSLQLPSDKAVSDKKEKLTEEQKGRFERVKEAYEKSLTQAAMLEKAGIPFGFSSNTTKPTDFMKNIQLMISNGLSEDAALNALTINNAKILGIQKYAGTLEKGKLANMVLTTKPLFEKEAQIKYVVSDGYIFEYETASKAKPAKENGTETKPTGTWKYVSESPAGNSDGMMTIEWNGEKYTGSITYQDPSGGGETSSPFNTVNFINQELAATFTVSVRGMSLEVVVKGDVKGDEFTGTLSLGDFGSFPLQATRSPNSF